MPLEIILPQLDPTICEVVVEQYYLTMGDTVRYGQPLALVRGQRFVWDIPATGDGTLSEILIQPGASAAVGTPLVRLTGAQQLPTPQLHHKQRVTPLARRVAADYGVDLASLTGTGPGGRITKADVLRAAEPTIDLQTTNRRPTMVDARRSTVHGLRSTVYGPHVLTALEVDLSSAIAFAAAHQARTLRPDVEITLTACIVHGMVETLQAHRYLNSVWSEAGLIVRGRIHLAISVSDRGQTFSSLIENAADLSLAGIARRLGAPLRDRSSNAVSHQAAPTFSISTTASTWLGYPPQLNDHSAHLHIGAPQRRAHVTYGEVTDAITVCPITPLILVYDARALTQTQADAFLCAVKQRLEHLPRM